MAKLAKQEWETSDELEFVSGLPQFQFFRYADSLRLRVSWGKIDPEAVILAVAHRKERMHTERCNRRMEPVNA